MRSWAINWTASWFMFWAGALMARFLDLRWAGVYCLAWFLVSVGIQVGRWMKT